MEKADPNRYWSGRKGEGETAQWLRDRAAYDGGDCLLWPFSSIRGYGNFSVDGEGHYAHRYMCELVNGPAPSPLHQAAHSCGNGEKGCVHPKHLSWKTPSQNQLDKRQHGRYNQNGRRKKLSPEEVLAIRMLRNRRTQDDLARMFNVSRRNIGAILDGRSWADLGDVSGQSTPQAKENT